ncbi:unnamed protein product [Miscanthus lutarioriparius]|uniref:Uncharacterized protein n=1 Tax=Miscanthus lutarioriparius TaxID=422564 RepID=A0A811S714_9POAL|nr:unnamed protein product [Miscanthus lutarioriparius]
MEQLLSFPDDDRCTRTGICGPKLILHDIPDKYQRLNCSCPESYEFLDAQHSYKGCTPNFIPYIFDGRTTPSMEVWTLTAGRQESGIAMKALIKVRQSMPTIIRVSLTTKLLYITIGVLAIVSVVSIMTAAAGGQPNDQGESATMRAWVESLVRSGKAELLVGGKGMGASVPDFQCDLIIFSIPVSMFSHATTPAMLGEAGSAAASLGQRVKATLVLGAESFAVGPESGLLSD